MALTKIKLDSMVTGTLPDANIPDDITITGLSGTNSGDQTLPTAGTLSGTELKSTVVTSSLESVGTIGTGVWQGTAVASAYLDSDTAHLSGTQTFTGLKSFSGNSMPQLIIKEVSGSPDVGLEFTSSGVGRGRIYFDDSTNNFVLQGTTYGNVGYSDDLVIDVNGNVGIGNASSSPSNRLTVQDSGALGLVKIYSTTGAVTNSENILEIRADDTSTASNYNLIWANVSGTSKFVLDGDGNATFAGVLSIGNHTLKQVGGDLEIDSAGGDLDIPTWIRMRASSGGTITSGWRNDATSKLHLGGDCTQTDYTLKIDATPLTAGSLYTAGNATFSGDVSTGNGGITWRTYTGTTHSTTGAKLVVALGTTLMAESCGMTFRIASNNSNPHSYGGGNASSVVGDGDIWCSLHNDGNCYIYIGSGYYSQPYKVCIFFSS